MTPTLLIIALAFMGLAALVALGIVWLIGQTLPAGTQHPAARDRISGDRFLFRDDVLVDHDADTLPDCDDDLLCWDDIITWFSPRFHGLPALPADLPANGMRVFRTDDPDCDARLEMHRQGRVTRITLLDPPHSSPAARHAMIRSRNNADAARRMLSQAPYPIWQTARDGALLWQNDAGADQDGLAQTTAQNEQPAAGLSLTQRVSIPGTMRPLWYEVQSRADDTAITHYATDITKIISAENTQRDFVQTLTKTFAYLTIGLAVFDRRRQLALFNPALVDLTSLSAEFLSARPDFTSFFDKLRDQQVMPEPRNYASWRAQISQLVASAKDGLYQETWSLPNDVTYRVTGRPHPDGAVAFLFEDISVEVMVARRYRAQLDLRQATIDALPDAMLVVGPNNLLSFCNDAAGDLLRIDPDSCFADMGVDDLISACADALHAPALWHEVETALTDRAHPLPWRRFQKASDGRDLDCRIEALPGGGRLLILAVAAAAERTRPRQLALP